MTSLPDQMEPGDSSRSLLSGRLSELGSRYVVESGVRMSSFTATIFITALVTIGVLLLTLLVALTVMLESCLSRDSGVIKKFKANDQYAYCSFLAFNAELNNLKGDENEFPMICKQYGLEYMTGGRFLRDFNLSVQVAENYFSTQTPQNDGLDVILVDVDYVLLLYSNGSSPQNWGNQLEGMKHLAHTLVLRLYMKLHASGWSLILFTRKPMGNSNATIQSLVSSCYGGWSSLIMRTEDEILMENWEYLSGRRLQLYSQGFRIASVISSRMDALMGPAIGKRNFKLVDPIYFQA